MRIGDTLRRLLLTPFAGPNLAVTRDRLAVVQPFYTAPLLREGLPSWRSRCTVVTWNGPRMACLASARIRGGPGAWEVDQLYLLRGEGKALSTVLELLTQRAGEQGARRIFLRLAQGHRWEEYAKMSGFFPRYEESLLEGQPGAVEPTRPDEATVSGVARHHRHGLFQLYCAATPAAVRQNIGVTFDEWESSRECVPGKKEELAVEVGGKVRAWLSISRSGDATQGQVVVHPDESRLLPYLVGRALSHPGRHLWLVPSYQESLLRSLTERGFKEVGSYSMLIKTVAETVREPSLAATEVIS